MRKLTLTNARVILPENQADASVIVADGLIDRIGDVATEGETIDLSGCMIFPGFIDVHNHGAVSIDVLEATAADLDVVSGFLATRGVTAWLPTTVPAEDETYQRVATAIESAQQSQAKGARVLGVHYEGPFVNSLQCGALHTNHFKTYSEPGDLDCLSCPADGVKMITLAPEIQGGIELIAELKKRGWVVSIGHTRANPELLDAAFANGARHMTHFMNAMTQLHHRSPGPVNWGLLRPDVTCDIIADGVHLHPSMLRLLLQIKGAGKLSLISDAIAAAGVGDGEYQIWGETITVKDGRTSNAAGSIAGSVISMLDAVKMMRSLGVLDVEVAQMASTNPARLLRLDSEYGSIEEGKRADLVALDSNGDVTLTIVGGEVVFNPQSRSFAS
jgi:N-acetylglucosamine-6-phosphate deacetylase